MVKSIVFFIQNYSRHAGSERVTSLIANELVNQGYDISILSICGDNTSFYKLDSRVKLYTLIDKEEVSNKKSFFSIMRKLKLFYKAHKVDLVIDVFAALSIYTILLKKKFGFKNITWEHFNYKVNTGMNRIGRKMAVRFSDQIITLTNTDKEYYEADNKIRGKIDYIYNPSPYQEVTLDKERKKWIISVGRLTYQKGFDRLIKVWKLIEDKCDWQMLIFGDGEDKESLQKQIDDLGLQRIKLMGAVKNIDEYYKQASLYVSTARFEGLPMTMIEAQSFGLPIISFDYDTGPREIVSDGVDGNIVSQNEDNKMIEDCADLLLKTMNESNDIEKYSKEALNSANRFKIKSILLRWNEVLGRM